MSDTRVGYGKYTTVAAGQTAAAVGTQATGVHLKGLLIVPAVAAAGAVTLIDGNVSITIYVGGATTALTEVKPIWVELGMNAVVTTTPGWKITTGADVSVIAVTS